MRGLEPMQRFWQGKELITAGSLRQNCGKPLLSI